MKALVVFSGGMDSATALAQAVRFKSTMYDDVEAISFDYGSKHNEQEWKIGAEFCRRLLVKSTRVKLDVIAQHFKSDLLKTGGTVPHGHYADPSMKKTVVPFRNGIMLSIAVGFAESHGMHHVILGNHAGDHAIYPDCRESFISGMVAAAREGTYERIEVMSPFLKLDKAAIVRVGMGLGIDYRWTYSCYEGDETHCGKCGTCYERQEAFQHAGCIDPTKYKE